MEWIDHLIPVIQNYASLGYWLIFLISFFEALVFIGSFIPGTPIIIFYGFLAASGVFNLADLLILSTVGAVAGDSASFYLGIKTKNFFQEKNSLLHTNYLDKSQKFFDKHGNKSIFWGRFIGIIKPFIPFTAGLAGMNSRQFLFWNVFSAIVWSISHLAVGYFFGGAFQVIETWITRIGLFALIAVIFFLVLWFSIKKGEKAWEYTVSFVQSTGWSFINSYPVRWFYHKFPRSYVFIANRLKRDSFWGMPFTLLSISVFVTALCLFTITRNVLLASSVVALDMRIENLLVVFRDSFLVKFFLCITALGEVQIIVSVVLIVTALLWLWKKRFYIMSLWITVAGSAASAYIAKILINRERPGGNIPVFTENFFSFPSGHSASIIALLGFLTYCVWRNYKTWRIRVNTFFIASFIVILVGFSRLYLGVHFLSDVLGGYLIGFLWMLLGIAISEWLIIRSRRRGGEQIIKEIKDDKMINEKHHWLKFFTGILVVAEVFYSTSFIISFKPIFNVVDQTAERQILVRDMSDPLFEKYIPKFPESLTGDYQTPLNFIVIASDDDSFKDSLTNIGWLSADPVGLRSLTNMIVAYLKGISYDTAPIAPLFWHGRPYDFVFQKPITDTNIGVRYKVRFWKTDIMTEDGGYVYVGSTELDKSIEYIILRNVSNLLDIARDELFRDMLKGKIISSYEKRPFVDNSRGDYYEKGKYITDGKAYFIYLR